ncbi:uncharacterized protein IL334_004253 [Kwoniella shivajii]|uniref:Major facilitator superfamily (MFS) profile domain-containing protein n=1 Tax=Kwoniella shivajii TaxID=564305 RepID=A0ABZ1CZU5_9TREE|nr:hypothetical protein IL334_004253 [Kwoniella shivajii]
MSAPSPEPTGNNIPVHRRLSVIPGETAPPSTQGTLNGSREYLTQQDSPSGNNRITQTQEPASKVKSKIDSTYKLSNPLDRFTEQEVMDNASVFATNYGLDEQIFRKGGLVARRPHGFERMKDLDSLDKERLRLERDHPYKQPWLLYNLVLVCSLSAAVQGMDESVISSAQLKFPAQFGINHKFPNPKYAHNAEWIEGLVNGAPYLCCSVIACWLNDPLNRWLGRRGTIFVTAFISFATCIRAACTNSWQHLFVARFCLGFGIGPKSATVPVFSAESVPHGIRGSLVMQWQIWTAFGIMLGYVAGLMFYHVADTPHITGLSWRLQLGSAGIPALFVMAQIFFLPESPRWLMSKNRHKDAYKAMLRLRGNDLLAARDLYYMHVLLEEEKAVVREHNRFIEIFTVARNRRAMSASTIVMFGQQFCGINACVYYTATIFTEAGFNDISALLASFGFGLINVVFALPGLLTIDKFGRRPLLLITFPAMSLLLLFTGFCFWIPRGKARIGLVTLGVYLYDMFYSAGEGPVPLTYSAECYPLYVRDLAMSLSTSTLWGFNFLVSLTFPKLLVAFKPQGAFGFYAGWCAILFLLIFFFLPETKGWTLEELDQVFSVPTSKHASYQLYNAKWHIQHYIFGSKQPHRPLYQFGDDAESSELHTIFTGNSHA